MNETVVAILPKEPPPPLELVVVAGPDTGKRFPVLAGRQTLGRSADNAITINDPTISKHHAVVEFSAKRGLRVYDTASLNGIFVGHKKEPVLKLRKGKKFQIGETAVEVVSTTPKKRRLSHVRFIPAALILLTPLFFLSIPRVKKIPESLPVPKTTTYPRETISHLKAREMEEKGEVDFSNGLYREAFRSWRKAASLNPRSKQARESLKRLERVAERLIEDALMTRSSNPKRAREMLTLAQAITQPSTPLHKEARRLRKEAQ